MKCKALVLAVLIVCASSKPHIPLAIYTSSPYLISPNYILSPQNNAFNGPVVLKPLPDFTFNGPVPAISGVIDAHKSPAKIVTAHFSPFAPALSQYHTQDDDGSYAYGYFDGPSSKVERRDSEGKVQGGYNYVDTDGEVQWVYYTAGTDGFQVAGTNLPRAPKDELAAPKAVEDTLEVREAKAKHNNILKQKNVHSITKREAKPKFYSFLNQHSDGLNKKPQDLQSLFQSPKTPASTSLLHTIKTPVVLQVPAVYQLSTIPSGIKRLAFLTQSSPSNLYTIPIQGSTFQGRPYIVTGNSNHNSFLNPGRFLKPIIHPDNAVSYTASLPPSQN